MRAVSHQSVGLLNPVSGHNLKGFVGATVWLPDASGVSHAKRRPDGSSAVSLDGLSHGSKLGLVPGIRLPSCEKLMPA